MTYLDECDRLLAENERLREALRQIAEDEWVPRPPGEIPAWAGPSSPFVKYLSDEEIARAALTAPNCRGGDAE